jgi:disulfide oxidoreductase YuzD
MDPITTSIIATLPALASDMVQSSVKDAYELLKEVIRRRWGDASPVAKAVDALETDPSSNAHVGALEEKIDATRATEDPDVMKALAKLAASLKKADIDCPASTRVNLSVQGGNLQGVIGAQHVTVATLSFGAPPTDNRG